MSVTVSATSQAVAVADWVRIFPRQATETYTSSVTFMKQLTTVAVSTITYMKNVFPEDSYTIENFGGMKLRILKKKCRDELAQFVCTSLVQAFEAFDKKYLQKLALCFYDGDFHAENLVECHTFEYSYIGDGVTMSINSKNRDSQEQFSKYMFDNVKERTTQLIRNCVIVMETQYQLPSSYDISLLLYYNDDAPEGYQAPGFFSWAEPVDHLEAVELVCRPLKLGVVATPFHRVSASSYVRNAIHSSSEAIPSQNVPMMTQSEDDNFNGCSGQRDESESSAARIVCSCQHTDHGEDSSLLLTCEYCGTQQHATCYGLRARVARHCCVRCSDDEPARGATDPRLAATPAGRQRECICILRRTLVWCGEVRAVGVAALQHKFGLSFISAVKLLHLLQDEGVALPTHADTDIKSDRKVVAERLDIVMKKYFTESGLAERLVAETLSQGPRGDPVGAALGPVERVTLHNDATMSKIIEPPVRDGASEDPTLKQYKEALLSHQQMEVELPLSGSHNPVKDIKLLGKKGKRKGDEGSNRAGAKKGTKKVKTIKK